MKPFSRTIRIICGNCGAEVENSTGRWLRTDKEHAKMTEEFGDTTGAFWMYCFTGEEDSTEHQPDTLISVVTAAWLGEDI